MNPLLILIDQENWRFWIAPINKPVSAMQDYCKIVGTEVANKTPLMLEIAEDLQEALALISDFLKMARKEGRNPPSIADLIITFPRELLVKKVSR